MSYEEIAAMMIAPSTVFPYFRAREAIAANCPLLGTSKDKRW